MGNACGQQPNISSIEIIIDDTPKIHSQNINRSPKFGSYLNFKNYQGRTIENSSIENNLKQFDNEEILFADHANQDEEKLNDGQSKFNSPLVKKRANRFVQDIELEVKSLIKNIQLEEKSQEKYQYIPQFQTMKSIKPTFQTSVETTNFRSQNQLHLRWKSQPVKKGILKNSKQQRQETCPSLTNQQMKNNIYKRVHFRGTYYVK